MSKKITIKNGGIEISMDRGELVDADQTPDGIVFNFKDGSIYHVIDMNMNIEVKEKIKQATNMFDSANIVIDVKNYIKPVFADLTKNI